MPVTVTSIQNPFQPEQNVKDIFEYVENQPVSHYLKHIDLNDPNITYIIAINGCIIDFQDIWHIKVSDNDIIAVCAKTEATATAAFITGFASFSAAASVGIGAALFYGATYLATSFLIGYGLSKLASLFAPDTPDLASLTNSRENSIVEQTYGWGELQQTEKEGVRIPYLFGKNKVAGHIINQFVSIDGNKEILNVLLGICDHEIDEISDIRINDQPYTYYKDVEVHTRLGSNSDDVIPGFNEIVTQTNVNSKLVKDEGVTIRTDGNQVDKLKVVITANRGLYYSNNSGGLDARTATFKIEYRLVGETTWVLFANKEVTAATTEAQRYTYDLNFTTPGQYEVKITRTNDAESSFRGSSDIYFTIFQEIVKEEQIYPGLAKYAVKALATEQLSGGTPSFTCLASKNTVTIYNEDTGYWEEKRATNPAWIVYSLLNTFADIPTTKIIYDEFKSWADYCDETIDDTYRFVVNTIVYDGNFWDEIQRISRLGNACIIRRGTRYGVFVDKPESIVSDMFTMGNIISGSFKMHYLPTKDRANAVEIEYTDVDRDYTRQVITIYSEDYLDNNKSPQKTNISIKASISQAEAVRHGISKINNNNLLHRVITFNAFVDSFAATVGDLFYFQHIIPDYSIGFGGRIIGAGNDDGNGNPYVQIDREITIGSGESYAILIRLPDNTIIEKIINSTPTTSDTLIITSTWDTIPDSLSIYNIGLVDQYKKIYRLTSVTRQDDFVRELTAVEYIPEVYTNNSNFIIEEIEDTTIVQQADNVTIEEYLIYDEFGTYNSELSVSWTYTGTKGLEWVVWLEDITAQTDPIKIVTTGLNTATIPSHYLIKYHQYQIYINVVGEGATNHFKNISLITIEGKDILPDNITYFYLQNNQLVWEYPRNINEIAGFKIKSGLGTNVNWTYADYINDGNFVTSPYSIESTGKVTTYLLKAFDYNGYESDVPATLVVNLGDILTENIVEETTIAPSFNGEIINGEIISDKLYSVNNDDFWSGDETNNIWTGAPGNIFFDSKYLIMTYVERFTPIYSDVDTIIEVDASAPTGLLIYYREAQAANYWLGNPESNFSIAWDSSSAEYKLLPAKIKFLIQPYDLKIVTNSGVGQSVINQINIKYDFPDIIETFEDIVISTAGTRLPITKTYKKIKNVNLTLQDDGGSAVTLNIVDKNEVLGPLIYAEDKDRNKTVATIDARIQGY